MAERDYNVEAIKREQELLEGQARVLREWKEHTPVYLASSSVERKRRLVECGFHVENIHAMPAPAEREVFALETYLTEYKPSWDDPRGSNAMAVIAGDKLKYLEEQGVPKDALWFAFDTMPVHYTAHPDWGKPEHAGSIWQGVAEQKPASLEDAKINIKTTFLLLMRNYLRYQDRERRGKTIDFASATHVKTAMAIHVPHEKDISVFTERIVLRPLWLYELARLTGVTTTPSDIHKDSPEALLAISVKPGKTVESILDDIIERIFAAMKDKGVDPTGISGGIAYHLDSVRNLLGIEEISGAGSQDEADIDRGIYTGFPKKLFEQEMAMKAIAARKKK